MVPGMNPGLSRSGVEQLRTGVFLTRIPTKLIPTAVHRPPVLGDRHIPIREPILRFGSVRSSGSTIGRCRGRASLPSPRVQALALCRLRADSLGGCTLKTTPAHEYSGSPAYTVQLLIRTFFLPTLSLFASCGRSQPHGQLR